MSKTNTPLRISKELNNKLNSIAKNNSISKNTLLTLIITNYIELGSSELKLLLTKNYISESEAYNMSKKTPEEIIQKIDATMSLEDMPLTAEDKKRLEGCIIGNTTVEAEIEKIKEKYKNV